MRSFAAALIVSLAVLDVSALEAQMSANTSTPLTPSGWAWTTDSSAEPQRFGTGNVGTSKFEFTHMAPGWHITMGPGGVLYPQTGRAEGRFVVEGEMIYFKDGADGAEYGVFVGGTALNAAGVRHTYTAFVVRPDGKVGVIQQREGGARMLMDWTAITGIAGRDSTGFARHRVTVRAEPDSVRFFVNDTRVAAWARPALSVDGSYGFRIGRGANLHITNLDLTQRLAPFPAPRPRP